MKTNKFLTAILFTATLFMVACSGSQESSEAETSTEENMETEADNASIDDFVVSAEDSKVRWRGEMLGIYAHEGTVNVSEATLMMENGQISGGSFVVDLTSITPTDENFNPEEGQTQEKLVGHLSSPDFFAVDSFPTASFTIESVEGNTAIGTLTIRGKSNSETVENITFSEEEGRRVVRGTMSFNRMNYDVSFEMPVADKVLSEDIQLDIKLIASN
ncbi:YceI family protein [Hyphobacterium sp. CCMP332]|nr:YceI family protein [Hyphobacterium sp. CCMP332]